MTVNRKEAVGEEVCHLDKTIRLFVIIYAVLFLYSLAQNTTLNETTTMNPLKKALPTIIVIVVVLLLVFFFGCIAVCLVLRYSLYTDTFETFIPLVIS